MLTMAMHTRTASDILTAVQETLSTQGLSSVTVVGHSLGGALALLDGVYLSLQLPENIAVKVISYGMPRVGNQAFADYVDSQLSGLVTHVNNKEDPVPTVPSISLGYHHPSGEIHIQDSSTWNVCPGAFLLSLRLFGVVWFVQLGSDITLRNLFRSGQSFQVVHRRSCTYFARGLERPRRAIRGDYDGLQVTLAADTFHARGQK
jgi:Lipase (class 3)